MATAEATLRDQITEALTREHYKRARERIEASPEQHCAALADAVMAVVQPEIDGWISDLNDALNHNDETCEAVKRRDEAEAAVERVRALHRSEYGCCAECTGVHSVPSPCPTITALDQPSE